MEPLWKRIAKGLGRAWEEGMVMSDPFVYGHYLMAKADAEQHRELRLRTAARDEPPATTVPHGLNAVAASGY